MKHPKLPLADQERAELLIAIAYCPEQIPAIKRKYRNYREAEFPGYLKQYEKDFEAWLQEVDHTPHCRE